MKKTKNLLKKIYVKRIWVNKNEYDYIYIPISQFDEVKKDEKFKLEKNKPLMMILEKAPFWYVWFRYAKENFIKVILFIIGVIVTAIITLLIEHYFKKSG
jgi:hypothetical protein